MLASVKTALWSTPKDHFLFIPTSCNVLSGYTRIRVATFTIQNPVNQTLKIFLPKSFWTLVTVSQIFKIRSSVAWVSCKKDHSVIRTITVFANRHCILLYFEHLLLTAASHWQGWLLSCEFLNLLLFPQTERILPYRLILCRKRHGFAAFLRRLQKAMNSVAGGTTQRII